MEVPQLEPAIVSQNYHSFLGQHLNYFGPTDQNCLFPFQNLSWAFKFLIFQSFSGIYGLYRVESIDSTGLNLQTL